MNLTIKLFLLTIINIGCASPAPTTNKVIDKSEYNAELIAYPIWEGDGASIHIKGPAAEYLNNMIKKNSSTNGIDCSKSSSRKNPNKFNHICKFVLTSGGSIVNIGNMEE